MSLPLSGTHVLDLTNVIAGPLASCQLALIGAEVIKVEVPGIGDLARKLGAYLEAGRKQMGTSYLAFNANKKSMALNLKSDRGKDVFRRLVAGGCGPGEYSSRCNGPPWPVGRIITHT